MYLSCKSEFIPKFTKFFFNAVDPVCDIVTEEDKKGFSLFCLFFSLSAVDLNHFCRKKKLELFFKTFTSTNQPWASLTRYLPRGDLHSFWELQQVQDWHGGSAGPSLVAHASRIVLNPQGQKL